MCQNVKLLRDAFWSDICNTDLGAYNKFLELCVKYGFQHVPVGDCDGTSADAGSECCSGDNVFCVDSSGRNFCEFFQRADGGNSRKIPALVGVADMRQLGCCRICSEPCAIGGFDNGHALSAERFPKFEENGVDGQTSVLSRHVGVHDGNVESIGDSPRREKLEDNSCEGEKCGASNLRSGRETVDNAGSDAFVGDQYLRGKNWARNNKHRNDRKRRKERKKKEMAENWREKKEVVVEKGNNGFNDKNGLQNYSADGDRKSGAFWNSTSDKVRQELIDSKARMHIAANNRRAAEDEAKLQRMNSPEGLISDLLRVSRIANQVRKNTHDQKIGGWAETVTDSITRSIAESAPSSIPSLESVGYGKSALRSSSGSTTDDSVESMRKIEYDMMVADTQRQFDEMEAVSDDHYNKVMSDLKKQYADVSMTESEVAEKKMTDALILSMRAQGMDSLQIERIFSEAGHEVDFVY